jgi:hypothetical protein
MNEPEPHEVRYTKLLSSRVDLAAWVEKVFGIDANSVHKITIEIDASQRLAVTAELSTYVDERLLETPFPEMEDDDTA